MDNTLRSHADKPDSTGHSSDPLRTIVVVDDDRAIAELTVEVLNEEPGYQAVSVGDGLRALELIRSIGASLVVTDVRLPRLDGFQLFDALRADPATAGIPVIFMAATRFDNEFDKRGIERPLMKPFDIVDLLARVAEMLPPAGAIDTPGTATYN
jgi:CheY-like chemotaxis protein